MSDNEIKLFVEDWDNFEKEKHEIYFRYYQEYLKLTIETLSFRFKSNSWLFAINTALLTGIGYLAARKVESLLIIIFSAASIFIAFQWKETIKSYRKTVKARFKILREMEKKLPVNMFRYDGKNIFGESEITISEISYNGVSTKEEKISWAFIVLYSFVLLYFLGTGFWECILKALG